MQGKNILSRWHVALLGLGGACVVFGVLGGLWRLDWDVRLPGTESATFHGALMAAAFLGTLIGLERAMAHGHRLARVGPSCAAAGGLAAVFGAPHVVSAALLLAGSIALAVIVFAIHRRQPAPQFPLQLVGALGAVAGNLLWLAGLPASQAIGAWIGFLVLTLVGEQIEYSHLQRPSPAASKLQAILTALLAVGAATLPVHWQAGTALTGLALTGFSLWLLANDVVRRSLRHHGAMRFNAVCLVGGYLWLGIGGLLLPFASASGLVYDAALHAVFLGFVFALSMGHAPTLFSKILGSAVPYRPVFYGHVVLLNATLLIRVAGDLAQRPEWRAWGGMGNAAAIFLFLAVTAGSAIHARTRNTA